MGISAKITEPYILIQDQKTSGTSGGAFTSGAWQTRDLNAKVVDTGGHASLAANQITLAPGTYRFRASAPATAVVSHQARLYDITNTALLAAGTSELAMDVYSNTTSRSVMVGRFTITAPTVIEIQHRCQTSAPTSGLGKAAGFGIIEVYSTIELWKEN